MDLITLDQAFESSMSQTSARHREFINPMFVPMLEKLDLNRMFTRGKGPYLWDDRGGRYLDFTGNFGAVSLGHNHPKLQEAVRKYLTKGLPTFCRMVPPMITSALGETLAKILPGDLSVSFFAQSGTEAVEGGMKLARAATGRGKLLSAVKAYHGKSLGSLSLTAEGQEKDLFSPLLSGCEKVPFGDLEALEERLNTKKFAAFVVEPIQSHGGVNMPPPGYLAGVQQVCRRTGTLFFLDEIATGFGRTGKMFASEHWDLEPDILTCGKALSGGLVPISAYTTTRDLWTKAYGTPDRYMMHASTFGDNNLGASVALTTLEVLVGERLVENAARIGEYFMRRLRELQDKHFLISDVRGKGLLLGVEFNSPPRSTLERLSQYLLDVASEKLIAFWIVARLLNDFNILTCGPLVTSRVLRFFPSLQTEKEEVDYFIESLDCVCSHVGSYSRLLKESSVSIFKHSVLKSARAS